MIEQELKNDSSNTTTDIINHITSLTGINTSNTFPSGRGSLIGGNGGSVVGAGGGGVSPINEQIESSNDNGHHLKIVGTHSNTYYNNNRKLISHSPTLTPTKSKSNDNDNEDGNGTDNDHYNIHSNIPALQFTSTSNSHLHLHNNNNNDSPINGPVGHGVLNPIPDDSVHSNTNTITNVNTNVNTTPKVLSRDHSISSFGGSNVNTNKNLQDKSSAAAIPKINPSVVSDNYNSNEEEKSDNDRIDKIDKIDKIPRIDSIDNVNNINIVNDISGNDKPPIALLSSEHSSTLTSPQTGDWWA